MIGVFSLVIRFLYFGFRINTTEVNPNISGKESYSSISSTGSESTSSSEGTDLDGDIDIINNDNMAREDSGLSMISLKVSCRAMNTIYTPVVVI